jgi:2-polyprenyl-6-methoxyphenol hydroxylase-like FAD-dependent oxidoreductase
VNPTVRHHVAALPSGQAVVGMGDTVCWMDPLGAQGANTATRCAAWFAEAILAEGDRPLDENWMLTTTARCWDQIAGPALAWTQLLADPSDSTRTMIATAAHDPSLADALVAAFADPGEVTALVG